MSELVSVIIPCHNSASYVPRAIESALKQTWLNLEIILVENNSTDDTLQILNAYRERFPQRIRVLQEKGEGATFARNRGLSEARGQWIQFLDSDDELLPGKIERQMSLVRGTNFDLVGGSYYYAKSGKKIRKLVNHDSWAGLITSSLGITSANLWNRSTVLRVGGFKTEQQSSQEYELMFRMLKTDAGVVADDKPYTIVYHRPESLGKTSDNEIKSRIWCNLFDLRLDIRRYLEKQNLFSGKLRFVWENHMYSHLVHLKDQFPEVYMYYMPLLKHKLFWFYIVKPLIGRELRKMKWRMMFWRYLPRKRKRLLFQATNELYADYLNEVAMALKGDSRLEIMYTSQMHKEAGVVENIKDLSLQSSFGFVPYRRATRMWWDAIFFASAKGVGDFHPSIPKILVKHGLGASKIKNGENCHYGAGRTLNKGKPKFACILDESEAQKNYGISLNPALENVLTVVGSYKLDQLAANLRKREEIRSELGIGPTEKTVLIMSTYGPGSLMQTWGEPFMKEVQKLSRAGKFRFLVTMHPNLWTGYDGAPLLGQSVKRFEEEGLYVIGPDKGWEQFFPAADAAISDFTSTALAFSYQKKPLAFVSFPPGAIDEKSILFQLYQVCPRLHHPSDLELVLREIFTAFPYSAVEPLIKCLNSYPGESAERTRNAVMRVLGL